MAKDKKSFVLYVDQRELFDQLDDELAGKLIKHIFSYCADEYPDSEDQLLKLAFTPIKLQLKRDLKKYENIVERNRINGSKGGRPSKPKKPTGLSGNPNKPKKADNDNDNDINILFDRFWDLYDKKNGKYSARKKWKLLKDSERETILTVLPDYVRWKSERQFRPDPVTFLNQRRWEDEIPKTKSTDGIPNIPRLGY